MNESKKYIVTGSAGFIGHHLSKDLLSQGHHVLGIDSLDNYYSVELKEHRQAQLKSFSNYEFLKLNLSDSDQINQVVGRFKPVTIFHMAAQAGVRLKDADYSKYVESNLVGFSNIAFAARNHQVPKFIYASSSSVYGNVEASSFSEKLPNLKPISFYGATKLAGEILASSTLMETSTRSRGLRFFTVYGEMGRPDMAYFRILASLINRTPFTVFGDGNDVRDFTYISDVISSIRALDNELGDQAKGFCDVVNIGGGNPRSLNEMIKILEIMNSQPLLRVEGEKLRVDVNKTVADFTYLFELIGMSPIIKLEEGLNKFTNWGKSNPKLISIEK